MTLRRLLVVGPGRLGLSLAAAVHEAYEPEDESPAVEVRGQRPERPSFLAPRTEIAYGTEVGVPDVRELLLEAAGGRRDGPSGGEASDEADRSDPELVLVFAVPDDALTAAAETWAEGLSVSGGGGGREPAASSEVAGAGSSEPAAGSSLVALHTSGVHGAGALAPLRAPGFSVGAWHPLTSVASPDASAFRDVAVGVHGDPAALAAARELARRVGGRPLTVYEGETARYHAAAVFASNFVDACLSTALRELWTATGGEARLQDLLPLARAALTNVEEKGLPDGLTGPVARGDVGTVRRHLEALDPEMHGLYRRLARELLGVVAERLPPDGYREMEDLLSETAEETAPPGEDR